MKNLLCLFVLVGGMAYAQNGAVRGKVVDAKTGEALPGANVLLQGTVRGTTTSASGEFAFPAVPDGEYSLAVSMVGYRRGIVDGVRVTAGQAEEVTARLTPMAILTDPVVVTATRREQSFLEAPVSVSTLNAAALSYRNSVTVDDALRYVSGVNMTEFQVNIRGSSGYSRGVGSRVLMLVDGIPLLPGDTGEINFETLPIGEVERVEVVKGSGSALYGSSAMGGVVNVLTRQIQAEPETRIKAYGGVYSGPSYGEWDWGGGTRLQSGLFLSHEQGMGDLRVRGYLSRVEDSGYRLNDWRRRYNAALKMRYDFSTYDALTFTANYMDQQRDSFVYWTDLSHAYVPPAAQQDDRIYSRRLYLSGIYTRTPSTEFSLSVRGLWYRNNFWDNVSEGGDHSLSDVVHLGAQGTWVPQGPHILTFGVDGNLDFVNANLFGSRVGVGGAVYAQDEIRLVHDLTLTLGARYDLQDVDSLKTFSQLNPKVALLFTPIAGTNIRASAGTGFRSPSVAEAFTSASAAGIVIVPNPSLNPERSFGVELGVNQVIGDLAVIDFALFQTHYTDLIESGFTASGQGTFSNVTEARIRGFELTSTVQMIQKLLFFDIGYTYVDPRDITANDVLKYRPRHLLYASLLLTPGSFRVGLDYRFISRVERIDEEFVALGIIKDGDQRVAIHVLDLRCVADLSWLNLPLKARFNINNLLQYNYVELIGNMMPPRSYVLTLESVL